MTFLTTLRRAALPLFAAGLFAAGTTVQAAPISFAGTLGAGSSVLGSVLAESGPFGNGDNWSFWQFSVPFLEPVSITVTPLLSYLFFSPLTRTAFGDMGSAMRDAPIRYFLVEHPVIMVIAIAVAHIGAAKVKRAGSSAEKFQRASIWFGLSLAAIAGFIPWARPLVPSF